jgi:hypothetical protein
MMIYPVPGRTVRDPVSFQVLPDKGREVPDSDMFWTRRLRDGDVTTDPPVVDPPAVRQERD